MNINRQGQVVWGISGGVYVDSRLVWEGPAGGGWAWYRDTPGEPLVLVGQVRGYATMAQGVAVIQLTEEDWWVLAFLEVPSGRIWPAVMDPTSRHFGLGANRVGAGAGVWAAWLAGHGYYDSHGSHIPAGYLLDVSRQGDILLRTNYQAGTGTGIARASTPWILEPVPDDHAYIEDGISNPHAHAGGWQVWNDPRLVVSRITSPGRGYVLSEDERDFNPDILVVDVNGPRLGVWSADNQGEAAGVTPDGNLRLPLRYYPIDTLEDLEEDLTLPTPTPTPTPTLPVPEEPDMPDFSLLYTNRLPAAMFVDSHWPELLTAARALADTARQMATQGADPAEVARVMADAEALRGAYVDQLAHYLNDVDNAMHGTEPGWIASPWGRKARRNDLVNPRLNDDTLTFRLDETDPSKKKLIDVVRGDDFQPGWDLRPADEEPGNGFAWPPVHSPLPEPGPAPDPEPNPVPDPEPPDSALEEVATQLLAIRDDLGSIYATLEALKATEANLLEQLADYGSRVDIVAALITGLGRTIELPREIELRAGWLGTIRGTLKPPAA